MVVFDLETTELIKPDVTKSEMSISVACATVLHTNDLRDPRVALDNSMSFSFLHSDANGAPISLLIELLRAASLNVV